MKRAFLILLAAVAVVGCAGTPKSTPTTTTTTTEKVAAPTPGGNVHKLASGLVYEDLVVGNGTMADPGLIVTVHYTGWLTDGFKFESSVERGQPLSFQLGAGRVIAGWEQGIKGMRVGGKRKLTIPPDMAYGPQGSGDVIPPNAKLVSEVELLGVK